MRDIWLPRPSISGSRTGNIGRMLSDNISFAAALGQVILSNLATRAYVSEQSRIPGAEQSAACNRQRSVAPGVRSNMKGDSR